MGRLNSTCNTISTIKALFFPIKFNRDVILSLRQIFREKVLSMNYKGLYCLSHSRKYSGTSNEKNLTMADNGGKYSLK